MNIWRLLLSLMVLFSWVTAPFIGLKNFKKYSPSVILICFIIMIESYIANKLNWWKFFKKLHPLVTGEFPFIIGPFFIGSLWIFKISKGKFGIYMILNLLADLFFCYPLVFIFEKLGLWSLNKLKNYQLLLLFLTKAVLMFVYQLFTNEKHTEAN